MEVMSPYISLARTLFHGFPNLQRTLEIEFLGWHMLPNKIRVLLVKEKRRMDIGPAPTEHTKTTIELVLFRKRSMLLFSVCVLLCKYLECSL